MFLSFDTRFFLFFLYSCKLKFMFTVNMCMRVYYMTFWVPCMGAVSFRTFLLPFLKLMKNACNFRLVFVFTFLENVKVHRT